MSAIEEIWRVGEKDMPGKFRSVIASQSSHSLVGYTIVITSIDKNVLKIFVLLCFGASNFSSS